jgi:hypothetical protein
MTNLSSRSPRFASGSVHMGSVVDKVALGQVLYSRVFRFYPVNIIPPWLSILIYRVGNEQLVAAVQRQSHSIDMNNRINLQPAYLTL